jgi:hypothetical protein
MNRGSTFFLKMAVILLGIPVLALCIFILPEVAYEGFEQAKKGSELAYIVFSVLLIMYVSAVPFYFALYQAFRLLSFIDKNQAFSVLSVTALSYIKKSAITISGLYVLTLPFVYIITEWDDAPGLIVIGMVIIGASMVVAVFAAVLKRLLQQAIQIKSENDLTV